MATVAVGDWEIGTGWFFLVFCAVSLFASFKVYQNEFADSSSIKAAIKECNGVAINVKSTNKAITNEALKNLLDDCRSKKVMTQQQATLR